MSRPVRAALLLVVFIAGVALESLWNHHATNLPLIMILTIISYIGGVSITRLLSRDSDDDPAPDSAPESAPDSAPDSDGATR